MKNKTKANIGIGSITLFLLGCAIYIDGIINHIGFGILTLWSLWILSK